MSENAMTGATGGGDAAGPGAAPMASVVILAKNEHPTLERSLDVILDQDVDLSYEVLLIDSGSTDGTVELVRRHMEVHPHLRLHQIRPQDFHHAGTRNLGASLARGRYVCFLGGDAIPVERTWLRRLMAPVLEQADGGDVVASFGRQIPKPNADVPNHIRMTFNYGAESTVKRRGQNRTSKDLYFFSSVNCCIDAARLQKPLFDEAVPVNEDMTLAYRIIGSDKAIAYAADAAVVHSHNYGLVEVFKRYFDNVLTYRRIGVHGENDRSLNRDGKAFLRRARQELKGRGIGAWLHFGAFLVCAVAGAKLGQHADRMPRGMRLKISKYGVE